jgi:hypothetical protein
MDSYDGCKQLWKDCIDYHAFFRSVNTYLIQVYI